MVAGPPRGSGPRPAACTRMPWRAALSLGCHRHGAPVTHFDHWKGGGFVPVPCGASGRVWGAHARVSADDAGGTGTPAAQWGDWSRAHARVRGDPGVARVVRDRRPGRT